jgi:hypothetical protein
MATADGNLTAAATWALCDPTAELDIETAQLSFAAGATFTDTTTFTPGAITVDGIALKLSNWNTTLPSSGTIAVLLRNVTDSADVAGTTVTVAYTDLLYLGTTANSVLGWAFFKFASPVTLTAGKAYAVKGTNTTGQAVFRWSSALGNTSRQLRTTTTQAPAAGDKLLINREWTGSGTSTARVVTVDSTLSTTGATLTGTGANNAGIGTLAWTNPTNIQADDGTYATVTSAANNAVTNYLRATNFGFAVPAGAVITGVQATVEWKSSAANVWRDTSVRLVKAGTGGGSSLAYSATLPTTDTVWTYGSGADDTWGNTLTRADVNDTGFGVELSLTHLLTASDTVSVDCVKITVYYVTVPVGAAVVSDGGTLQYATSASTNYALAISGLAAGATSGLRGLEICSGGTFTMGTSGTRMPSTSTALLYFAVASAVQFGTEVRGTGIFRAYGATKTPWTRLNTTAAANATALTVGYLVGDTTGWAVGDEVAIGGSNRSSSETELRTLSAIGSSTTCTLLQPLTTAKEGGANAASDPVGVPVANLTRNVVVCGVSNTLTSYVAVGIGSTFDTDNSQYQYVGSATASKQGLIALTTSTAATTFTLRDSVVRDLAIASANLVTWGSSTGSFTADGNVLYGVTTGTNVFSTSATSGAHTITDNCVIGRNRSVTGVSLGDVGSTATGNLVTDCNSGITLAEGNTTIGTFSGNTVIYNSGSLLLNSNNIAGTISSCVIARNNGTASSGATQGASATAFISCLFFGNNNAALTLNAGGEYDFRSCEFYSESSYAQAAGLVPAIASLGISFRASDCEFGVGGTHSTGDISISSAGGLQRSTFYSCIFASTTEVATQTNLSASSVLASVNHDNVAGAMKAWKRYGTITSDTSIYRTASPSLRLTPNNASFKLNSINESAGIKAAVANAGTVTISAYVRKSVVGDGAAYTGNQPRLMLRRNPQLGITDDTVIATATNAANGAFELLTGTTSAASAAGVFEFFLDCDGTAGWVNLSDVTMTVTNLDTSVPSYFLDAIPFVIPYQAGGGAGNTGLLLGGLGQTGMGAF